MSDLSVQLKELHPYGFKGVLNVLAKKGTLRKYPFYCSLAFSALLILVILTVDNTKLFFYLEATTDLLLEFFPNLLGFSLGGYALVVGFSNTTLIKQGTKTNDYSIYQILNAIFSLCIILQVSTTILCFFTNWFITLNICELFGVYIEAAAIIFNATILGMLVFGALYSLFLTPFVVSNLFTLSQLNNLHLTIEAIKDQQSDDM